LIAGSLLLTVFGILTFFTVFQSQSGDITVRAQCVAFGLFVSSVLTLLGTSMINAQEQTEANARHAEVLRSIWNYSRRLRPDDLRIEVTFNFSSPRERATQTVMPNFFEQHPGLTVNVVRETVAAGNTAPVQVKTPITAISNRIDRRVNITRIRGADDFEWPLMVFERFAGIPDGLEYLTAWNGAQIQLVLSSEDIGQANEWFAADENQKWLQWARGWRAKALDDALKDYIPAYQGWERSLSFDALPIVATARIYLGTRELAFTGGHIVRQSWYVPGSGSRRSNSFNVRFPQVVVDPAAFEEFSSEITTSSYRDTIMAVLGWLLLTLSLVALAVWCVKA
jgi:hypothetical protein